MKNQLLSGSLAVFSALIICKISAFLQDMIIAANLGATELGDAFNTVNGIQDTIYPMLAVGISQVFLPAYKSLLIKKGQEKADTLANYAIVFFTILSIIIVLLLVVFASQVVSVVVPGFSQEQKNVIARLVQISAISYTFTCIASIYSSILIAHSNFFASEIRGLFTHIPIIIAAVIFYDRYGLDALAYALIIASIMRLVVLLPFLHKGYKFNLFNSVSLEYAKSLLSKLPAAFVSSGVIQLNTLVDKMMASTLAVGSISCLNYGTRVYMVLQELLANVLATSSYPQIIELIAKNELEKLEILIRKITLVIFFVTVPVSIGGIVYSRQIIDFVFVRGAFTIDMGEITASVFGAYLLALSFSSLNGIFNNIYFGFGDTKSPMTFNILNLMLNIVFNFIFMRFWGLHGIALATSLASLICFITRFYFIQGKLKIKIRYLAYHLMLIFVGSLISVFAAWNLTMLIKQTSSLLTCLVAIIIASIIYIFLMYLLKCPVCTDAQALIMQLKSKKKGNKI